MDGLTNNDDKDDFFSQPNGWQLIHLPVEDDKLENKIIKMWGDQELLIRNHNFIKDIDELKKKYSKSGIEVNSIGEDDECSTADRLRKEFYKDARKIADKIDSPGDWLHGVWDVIIGLTPVEEISCYPAKKSIVTRKHNDHIDVKIYGNVTVAELRTAATEIRKYIETLDNLGTTDNQKRIKTKLDKSLLIYQMSVIDKKTDLQIAEYFAKHYREEALTDHDVHSYVDLAKKQIEDIYA